MTDTALVVDDETQMVSIVAFALETQGFHCRTAGTVADAWRILGEHRIDIAVVDRMLPDGSGLDLTRRIRASDLSTSVIMLTALGDEDDRILGLEAGADDYVTKPFSPRELALRAQAVLRRTGAAAHDDPRLEVGDLTIDLRTERAYWLQRRVDVSATEFRVLAVLAQHVGHVVGYQTLLNEAWATTSLAGGREMIKTSVYRLRRKLQDAGADPAAVEAIRGQGYRLTR